MNSGHAWIPMESVSSATPRYLLMIGVTLYIRQEAENLCCQSEMMSLMPVKSVIMEIEI